MVIPSDSITNLVAGPATATRHRALPRPLGLSDHVSEITLDGTPTVRGKITATPHLACAPTTPRGLSCPPTCPAKAATSSPASLDTESANMRTSGNAGVW